MAKFKIRFTVENPNCLFYDVEIEADNESQALDKSEELDLDGVVWEVSEGNYIDTGEAQCEVIDGF